MDDRDLWPAAVAEFIGPFTLVIAGVGAIISTQNLGDGGNLVAVSLAHGLAIGLMVAALGVSGGHFNPAVTISMLATGEIGLTRAITYIVAQVLGATAGAGVLTLVFPALGPMGRNNPGGQSGLPGLGPDVSVSGADHGSRDDVLPGHGHLRDRRRSARSEGDRAAGDRLDHHHGHPDGRAHHRRRDEPGTRPRSGDRPAGFHELVDLLGGTDHRRPDCRVCLQVDLARRSRSDCRLCGGNPSATRRTAPAAEAPAAEALRRLSQRDAGAGAGGNQDLTGNQRRAGFQSLRMVSLICFVLAPAASASRMAG